MPSTDFWGAPAAPPVPPPPAPRYVVTQSGSPSSSSLVGVRHRPWSTLLLVLHWLQLAAAVLVVGAGMLLLTQMSGLGGLGVLGGAVGAVLVAAGGGGLAVAVVLVVLTVTGRRRADDERPGLLFALGVVATVLGGLSLLGLLAGGDLALAAVNVVASGVYIFAGVRTFLAARR